MRKLDIFDTTLRDGEQSLGITLNVKEKLEIARQLVRLGVDVIEAGFPASSSGDFHSVQTIGKEIKGVVICGLTRCVPKDIDCCAEALKMAEQPRIHTGIGVSAIHMEKKLRMSPEKVIETAVAAVKHAKSYLADVEFYAEDAFRSDPVFLAKVLKKVIDAGATVVNIPDTVGYATPWEYGELISYVKNNVENIHRAKISVHCHNDLGMATANAMAGIIAGADQVEGTINGIGERAGNTSLEEVIMAIYTKKKQYALDFKINAKEIAATSRLVSNITGVPVPSHKAIVGANAFMHASGIHQDGVLKEKQTYEIINPETIGLPGNKMVLSARSGRHALKSRLAELGYTILDDQINQVYNDFIQIADRKQEVFDEDLHYLMGVTKLDRKLKIINVSVATSGVSMATATVTMEVAGSEVTDAATGNGPVDAVFQTINRITGKRAKLQDYSLRSLTRGTEAIGNATVKISIDDEDVLHVGSGSSTDIIMASAKAYVDALEKYDN